MKKSKHIWRRSARNSVAIALLWVAAAFAVSAQYPDIQYDGDRLLVRADNATLSSVLDAVTQATGIEFRFGEIQQQVRDWDIEAPVGEAIKSLLDGYSTILVTEPVPGQASRVAIRRVHIIGTGESEGRGTAAPLRPQSLAGDLATANFSASVQNGPGEARIGGLDRLTGLMDRDTLGVLTQVLRHDPDPEVRKRAVAMLAEIPGEAAASVLESGLGDSDSSVRAVVIDALMPRPSLGAVMALGQVMIGDADPELRARAYQALREHPHKRAAVLVAASRQEQAANSSGTATAPSSATGD